MQGPATPITARHVPRWFWLHLCWPVVLAVAHAIFGWKASGPLALVLYFPWLVAQVPIRLGAARVADALAELAAFTFRKDIMGASPLAAALALVHQRRHDENLARRIEALLDASPPPMRGAAIAARALVAASRGHAEAARDLFRSVELLDPRITPGRARAIARAWLAADAAARGDWDEVIRLSRAPGPRPRLVRFLGLAGRRLARRADAPGDRLLRLACLAAPNFRATRPLLDRCLATPRGPAPDADAAPPPAGGSRLASAAAQHVAALAAPPGALDARVLRRLGRAWAAALADPATGQALLERELALGADGKSDALRVLRARVEAELAFLLDVSALPLPRADAGLLAFAAHRVQDRLFEDLQADAERILARATEHELLPPAEEWRALARLRAAHAAAVARLDASGRRIAWEIVMPALSGAAVRLFNLHQERSVANAVFRFLADEAAAVGDDRNGEVNRRNVNCGW